MNETNSEILNNLRQILGLNDMEHLSENSGKNANICIEIVDDGKRSKHPYAVVSNAHIHKLDALALIELTRQIPIAFKNCEFSCEFIINNQDPVNLEVGHLEFDGCHFKSRFCIIACIFKKTCIFEACIFSSRAEFINVDFLGFTSFFRSAFLKIANFVNINFTFVPNFCACVLEREYRKIVTFSNIQIANNKFDEVKKTLETGFNIVMRRKSKMIVRKNLSNNKQDEDKIKKDEAIDILQKRISYLRSSQESICEIKRNFTKRDNKIDAGLYRRLELYIRELVLSARCELIKLKSNSILSAKGLLEMFFEKKVVEFYRKSSNHHTKFLPILNTTILMVVSYGLFLWIANNVAVDYHIYADDSKWIFYTPIIIFLTPFLIGNYFSMIDNKTRSVALYGTFCILLGVAFWIVMGELFSYLIKYICILSAILSYLVLNSVLFGLINHSIYAVRYIASAFSYLLLIFVILVSPNILNPISTAFDNNDIIGDKLGDVVSRLNSVELNAIANIIRKENTQKKYERPLNVIREYQEDIYDKIQDMRKNGYENYDKNTARSLENVYNAIGMDYTLGSVTRATLPFYIAIMLLCIFSLSRTGRRASIVPES
ncbi:MAG: hypothetical protein K5978_07110 [Campylobacter sp.]|nr:hypothetical protein [Campylobacter sp.]